MFTEMTARTGEKMSSLCLTWAWVLCSYVLTSCCNPYIWLCYNRCVVSPTAEGWYVIIIQRLYRQLEILCRQRELTDIQGNFKVLA